MGDREERKIKLLKIEKKEEMVFLNIDKDIESHEEG
jgi:hypothetical protein